MCDISSCRKRTLEYLKSWAMCRRPTDVWCFRSSSSLRLMLRPSRTNGGCRLPSRLEPESFAKHERAIVSLNCKLDHCLLAIAWSARVNDRKTRKDLFFALPRNFTNPKFHKNRTDGEMFWVIKNGSAGTGGTEKWGQSELPRVLRTD